MSEDTISIAGIDKAELLAALYNHSRPMGMGWLQARDGLMTKEQAQKCIEDGDDISRMFGKDYAGNRSMRFDYLFGRPLKIDIGGDELATWGYNRDNGQGAAQRIVESLRSKAAA